MNHSTRPCCTARRAGFLGSLRTCGLLVDHASASVRQARYARRHAAVGRSANGKDGTYGAGRTIMEYLPKYLQSCVTRTGPSRSHRRPTAPRAEPGSVTAARIGTLWCYRLQDRDSQTFQAATGRSAGSARLRSAGTCKHAVAASFYSYPTRPADLRLCFLPPPHEDT